ncbi:ornithine cyclodeaminase family protein [Cellulomonas dongxiuzhuiae]|uniref:ornithine cyclodeaminase family protein n=1 Tax=Cellulomonas dongxiuzhuiae TaxID=2819979 RepID=UPI001AAE4577|nr:ornithine cyclodeaminase family protein [Cellulomonas dongxiuzhuiae]MBO3087948.1 ornithine cyclodeaminase family protein [Cellulomonas dongxiuzhuiae]
MLVLTAADVRAVLDMPTAMETTLEAARAHVAGRTSASGRVALSTAAPAGDYLVMPGTVGDDRFGVKTWYTASHGGARSTRALVLVLDPETGDEVLMDGSVITDLRTGAMTGIAATHLAPPDASVATVIGAGAQARTQALALAVALPGLTTLRVTSRTAPRRDALVATLTRELAPYGIEVVGVDDTAVACRGADVVVAATTSSSPVVRQEWLGADVLVCGVGSHAPGAAELDPRTVAAAEVVAVDTRAGGIDGAGDISRPIADGLLRRQDVLELGELGARELPRSGIRVFKSAGFAAADVTAGHHVARAARAAGLGLRIDLHGPAT